MMKTYTYSRKYINKAGEIRECPQNVRKSVKSPKFHPDLPRSITEEILNYATETKRTYEQLKERFGISNYAIYQLNLFLKTQ